MKRPFELLRRPWPLTEGGMNVRPVEVATLEEEGLGTRLRQRIDRAIGNIQFN
jgi:hypothetical protein